MRECCDNNGNHVGNSPHKIIVNNNVTLKKKKKRYTSTTQEMEKRAVTIQDETTKFTNSLKRNEQY